MPRAGLHSCTPQWSIGELFPIMRNQFQGSKTETCDGVPSVMHLLPSLLVATTNVPSSFTAAVSLAPIGPKSTFAKERVRLLSARECSRAATGLFTARHKITKNLF